MGFRSKKGLTVFPVVMFIHIPKCGGRSVIVSMKRVLGAEEFCGSWRDYFLLPLEEERKVRFCTGHVSYGRVKCGSERKILFVSVMRDPIDRTLSHIYHGRMYDHWEESSLVLSDAAIERLEFLDDRFSYFRNIQTFRLSDLPVDASFDECYDRACENLSKLVVLGITDYLGEFIMILNRRFGFVADPAVRVGVNPNRPKALPSSHVLEAIASINEYDIPLYEHAKELLGKR